VHTTHEGKLSTLKKEGLIFMEGGYLKSIKFLPGTKGWSVFLSRNWGGRWGGVPFFINNRYYSKGGKRVSGIGEFFSFGSGGCFFIAVWRARDVGKGRCEKG